MPRFLWPSGSFAEIIDGVTCRESDPQNEVSKTMTTSIQLSEKPEIEYPDDDGEPMSDNTLQFKWIVLIKENLEIVFRDNPNVFVAGNLLWYPVEGDPTIRTAPDAMVAIGRPKGRRGSYKQWEEGNVPPAVVFETLSPGNRPGELDRKFRFYQQYGVLEYYIYDPDSGSFEAWIRSGSRLVRLENASGFVSPRLRTRFEPGEGPDNLTIFAPDGSPFLTSLELKAQADADRQRADSALERAEVERKRAEAEGERADSAANRAERLAARLRNWASTPMPYEHLPETFGMPQMRKSSCFGAWPTCGRLAGLHGQCR